MPTREPTEMRAASNDYLCRPVDYIDYRAPIVRRTSLRRVSSNSSKLSAVSHSSHSTSSTAGRLSSVTSTRPPSRLTTCICNVLTRKFRSLPQFGQVNVTHSSPPLTQERIRAKFRPEPILWGGVGQAQCKI